MKPIKIIDFLPGEFVRILTSQPAVIEVPAGYYVKVQRVESPSVKAAAAEPAAGARIDRRTGPATRRARGDGSANIGRRILCDGRRAGDRELHEERRVGPATRRERGKGMPIHRAGRCYSPYLPQWGYGRRAGDRELHEERRKTPAGNPLARTKDNPLGQWIGRRNGDERRMTRLPRRVRRELTTDIAAVPGLGRRRGGPDRRVGTFFITCPDRTV